MDRESSNEFGDRREENGTSRELTVTAVPHAQLDFCVRLESPKASAFAKYRLQRFRVRALVHMLLGWLKATKGWDASGTPDPEPDPEEPSDAAIVGLRAKLDALEEKAKAEGDNDLTMRVRDLRALYQSIDDAAGLFERVTTDDFRETPLGEAVWVDIKSWLGHRTVEAVRKAMHPTEKASPPSKRRGKSPHDRTDCPRCGETLRTSSYIECEEERDQLRLELHRLKTKYGVDTLQTISVTEHFSKFPGGRTQSDGPHSGEAFRDTVLAPALRQGRVRVVLDGTMGYGSSFLEEAFGGLLGSFTRNYLDERLTVEATDKSLVQEVWEYIHKTPNPAR